MAESYNGTVKFFNETKGYGFLTEETTGDEIFVHFSSVKGRPTKGDKVTFEIVDGKKGPNAANVVIVK